MQTYWQITLTLPSGSLELPEDFLGLEVVLEALSLTHILADNGAPARYALLYPGEWAEDARVPVRAGLKDALPAGVAWAEEDLAEENWLEKVYEALPPLSIGRFVIHGTHIAPDVPEGGERLVIVAATAFGTGRHPTTRGCVEALDRLAAAGFRPGNCADIGTGSGILALAAHRLFACPVLATDNDPESIRLTRAHADMNAAPENFTTHLAEGIDGFIRERGPYGLVIANILAGPLKEMAADIAAIVAPGGRLILSGILDAQAGDVLARYAAQGMAPAGSTVDEGWSTLVLKPLPQAKIASGSFPV